MKCEICHKNDAKKAIRLTEGGKEKELYVCGECADRHARRQSGRNGGGSRRFGHVPDIDELYGPFDDDPFGVEGLPFPEEQSELFGEGEPSHRTLADDTPPCPNCGTTMEDVANTGLVGCPQCYVNFKESLKQTVGLHGSFGGKVPNRRGDASGSKASGASGQ